MSASASDMCTYVLDTHSAHIQVHKIGQGRKPNSESIAIVVFYIYSNSSNNNKSHAV